MAEKEKKIVTAKEIAKIMSSNKDNVTSLSLSVLGNSLSVNVQKHIPFESRCKVILDTVNACFDDAGYFHPEFMTWAFKYLVVLAYSNLDPSISLSDFVNFDAVSNICDAVKTVIVDDLSEMYDDAEKEADYRVSLQLRNNSIDPMCASISKLINDIDDLVEAFSEQQEKDGTNISMQDVMKMFAAVSSQDEKETVNKILDYQEGKQKAEEKQVISITKK